ncbi:MAG: hypothetical protein JWM89_3760 [Acidimicrobiales bacterium]|nr:hypothetical protein [Acidimicrobiales bacterium]
MHGACRWPSRSICSRLAGRSGRWRPFARANEAQIRASRRCAPSWSRSPRSSRLPGGGELAVSLRSNVSTASRSRVRRDVPIWRVTVRSSAWPRHSRCGARLRNSARLRRTFGCGCLESLQRYIHRHPMGGPCDHRCEKRPFESLLEDGLLGHVTVRRTRWVISGGSVLRSDIDDGDERSMCALEQGWVRTTREWGSVRDRTPMLQPVRTEGSGNVADLVSVVSLATHSDRWIGI